MLASPAPRLRTFFFKCFPLAFGAALAVWASPAAPAGLSVDIKKREAVRNFYNALLPASENVAMGWTGSIGGCVAGTTSQAFRNAVALRLNMVRALAGVPAGVVFDAAYNAKAQQDALMTSANNALDHHPPSGWKCYTAAGAEAAGNSNISKGVAGPRAILGYIEEPDGAGIDNSAVGHRRWLLYPQTQKMGTGDVAGDSIHPPANTLWRSDNHIRDARPAVRDGFVAWPPPGFVPYPLVYARWSLAYPGADFSAAKVSMSLNGAKVPVDLEAVQNFPTILLGENTLVWKPSHTLLKNPAGPLAGADARFAVSVSDVRINGVARTFGYSVTLFDPARYGADTVLPQATGSATPASKRANAYSISGKVPAADGYDWLYAKASAYATVLGAEGGLAGMAAAVSPGYAVATGETSAGGAKSYHLLHAKPENQILALGKVLMPGPTGALSFQSRLGWAFATETAAVQVSLDNGINWQDVYAQRGAGEGKPGEAAFVPRRVSLAKFAGRALRVRFVFKFPAAGGSYYPGGSGAGWYIDNVAFSATTALDSPKISAATAAGFTFTPPAPGRYLLAARGKVKGHPLEWGKPKAVTAQ